MYSKSHSGWPAANSYLAAILYDNIHKLKDLNRHPEAIKLPMFTSIRLLLRHKEIANIKKTLNNTHMSALCYSFDLSIVEEDYEICNSLEQVIAERPLLNI